MKYKGYYIEKDSVNGFHSKQEIDDFFKEQAVNAYKQALRMFDRHSTMECSVWVGKKAERLVEYYGFTWEQVEELEIETFKSLA